MDRQKLGMDGKAKHIVMYPEGTTSNGTCLLPFKEGAFITEFPVRPIVYKYFGFPGRPVLSHMNTN